MSRTPARSPSSCAPIRASPGSNYAGFADSPYHALAQKYLGGRASSLLTFGVSGGLEAGKAFYDALRLIKRLVNIGDAKSLACHPASTTHRQMTAESSCGAGVRAGDDPPQRRHRAHRRHHRRPRPGAAGRRTVPRPRAGGGVTACRSPSSALPRRRRSPICANGATRRGSFRDRGKRIEIGLVNNMPDAARRGDRAPVRAAHRGGERRIRRAPAPVHPARRCRARTRRKRAMAAEYRAVARAQARSRRTR